MLGKIGVNKYDYDLYYLNNQVYDLPVNLSSFLQKSENYA